MKKRKRILCAAIILIFIAILIMCLVFINFESKYVKKIEFSKKTEMIGIIYLGGLATDYDYTVVNKYYTNEEQEHFATLELGGEECYLVIPRFNIPIIVNKLIMCEDGGTDKKWFATLKTPFFIKCNISDIFSNAEINFKYKGEDYVYSPYISLMDGSVVTEDFVYLIEE